MTPILGFSSPIRRHHDPSENDPRAHHNGKPAGGAKPRGKGSREIKVVRRVLDANEEIARRNREVFADEPS